MSRGFTVHERIPFPVQVVWTYVSDMELAHTWIKGVNSMTPVDPSVSDRVGARYQTNVTGPRQGAAREVEILAWEPNHRFALASNDRGIEAIYEYVLRRRNENATDVILNAECTASGLWNLALPFVVRMMKKHDADQLVLLRRAMEATSTNMEKYFEVVN